MKQSADVVIIGGGIMGVCIAAELAGAGVVAGVEADPGPGRGSGSGPATQAARVLLLEKRAIAAGSTGKSGAILRQHYSHETTIRMARESLAAYASFEGRTGRDIGFRRTGMCFLAPESERARLERNIGLQRGLGVDATLMDAGELAALEPRASFGGGLLGCWEPEAGTVEPTLAAAAIADEARAAGAEIRVGSRVTAIETEGARVTGVRTADGDRIATGTVINAGGPWARGLLEPHAPGLPLRAIRPEQAYFGAPPGFGSDTAVFADLLTGIYWKPERAGWTRVGKLGYEGDAEVPDPDAYDEGVSHQFIDFCRERLARRVPAFRGAISWGGCGALYTVTPDAHALIGPVPGVEGLYVVSGFSGHGFKLGPAVARLVGRMVVGSDAGVPELDMFAVDRFARGREVISAYEYGILG